MEMGAVLVAPSLKPDVWMFGVRISFFFLVITEPTEI